MRIVIWNDVPDVGNRISTGLVQAGFAEPEYSVRVIIATSYDDFAAQMDPDFVDIESRRRFFNDSLLVSDLGLANGVDAVARAQPFRDLMNLVHPYHDHHIIVFSANANLPAVVGEEYFHHVRRLANANVRQLAVLVRDVLTV